MPAEWRDEVVDRVKESPDSYIPLHLGEHDDFLAIFVSELAEVSPPIRRWISRGGGGELGERIRTAEADGYRGREAATIPPGSFAAPLER